MIEKEKNHRNIQYQYLLYNNHYQTKISFEFKRVENSQIYFCENSVSNFYHKSATLLYGKGLNPIFRLRYKFTMGRNSMAVRKFSATKRSHENRRGWQKWGSVARDPVNEGQTIVLRERSARPLKSRDARCRCRPFDIVSPGICYESTLLFCVCPFPDHPHERPFNNALPVAWPSVSGPCRIRMHPLMKNLRRCLRFVL